LTVGAPEEGWYRPSIGLKPEIWHAPEHSDPASREPIPSHGRTLRLLVRASRPRQWTKNLLVFVAPAAAGSFGHAASFGRAAAAFGIFCLVASGTYLINDTVDAEVDRHHPVKQHRPVASGELSSRRALTLGIGLAAMSIGAAWALAGWELALVVATYSAVSIAYSIRFKREPVIELAFLATGFVLRAVAGGVATGVPLSNWFLAVTCFGALFVATGKRAAELELLGPNPETHRESLAKYTASFLRSTLTLTASVTVTAYCLWAFGSSVLGATDSHDKIWIELTVIPMILGILHVLQLLDRGEGGAPEELVFRDRMLQLLGLVWVTLFGLGIYT